MYHNCQHLLASAEKTAKISWQRRIKYTRMSSAINSPEYGNRPLIFTSNSLQPSDYGTTVLTTQVCTNFSTQVQGSK